MKRIAVPALVLALVVSAVALGQTVDHGTIEVGMSRENHLNVREEHRYTLRVSQPQTVIIEMDRIDTSHIDPYLSLLDAGGREIAYNDDFGGSLNSRITQHLNPGTYAIIAREFGRDDAGRYRLTVREGTTQPDTRAHTQADDIPIAVGQRIDGYITMGREDYYRITVPSRQVVQIDMVHHEGSSLDPYLILSDMAGNEIMRDDDGGGYPDSRMIVELDAGTYRLTAQGFGNWSEGGYAISVMPAAAISRDAISLPVGQVYNGFLQPGEEQDFTFSLNREQFVVIDFMRAGDSPIDPYMVLYDEHGREIDRDDDGGMGLDSRIRRTLPAGTYRLSVYDLGRSRSGAYQVAIATGTSPRESAIPIAVGQGYDGFLQVGEEVVYALTVTSPQDVVIDFMRAHDSNIDPYLILQDSTGMEITRDDDGGMGLDSRIRRRLDPGTYFIIGHDLGMSRSGQFRISVAAGDSPAVRAIPLSLGQNFDGFMRAGEEQIFTFTLRAPQRVVIDFMALHGADFDPYLILSDSSMNEVARDDDGGEGLNSRIDRVLNPGVYYVTGRDFWNGQAGSYRMSVQPR